jgi:hypothetical protein
MSQKPLSQQLNASAPTSDDDEPTMAAFRFTSGLVFRFFVVMHNNGDWQEYDAKLGNLHDTIRTQANRVVHQTGSSIGQV